MSGRTVYVDYSFENVNLHREDLFSFYSYKPYTILYFKVLKSTQNSLKKDFLHLCKNLIENETDEELNTVDIASQIDEINSSIENETI